MRYLSEEAANLFLGISRFSLSVGITNYETFLARIDHLCHMLPSSNQKKNQLLGSLHSERWDDLLSWPDDSWPRADHSEIDRTKFKRQSPASPGVLLFISSIPGMNQWEFHKGDPDPYPSVPHGHHCSTHHNRLDPYLGRVYCKSQELKRVPRDLIIELWNSKKFREFSIEAIEHFRQQNLNWTGWRVANPKRIPRIRQRF